MIEQEKKNLVEVIPNRYRVDRVLGQGGMAIVYKVYDNITLKAVALKQLIFRNNTTRQKKNVELFEREFHLLMHLSHPRVIEVYDYGVEQGHPYYTMELLDGGDLRELTPLAWKKACTLMLDISSVLSLLHSRKVVHRDVSPRNIRCTSDDLAKLIDFGAMVPMGPCRQVVGTVPFVAPEVTNLQTLDGRADLYSLGTTLYYVLTGRHAYPAINFKQLRDSWRIKPVPPSEIVNDIPMALDSLVMSLVHVDPQVRPANAAEVMERLSVIADFRLDEQLMVSQAYLTTPTLVGRHWSLKRIRKNLIRTQKGHGVAVLVHGTKGMGRTRFIDACVLEGKLMGATVIRADSTDAKSRDYGAIQILCKRLLEAAPEEAFELAKDRVEVLGHVFPELMERCDIFKLKTFDTEHQFRPEIQNSFTEWLLEFSQRRSLLVAIDDIHRIDEPSSALLALLSHKLSDYPLMLIASSENDVLSYSNSTFRLFVESSIKIELQNLSEGETLLLLKSIFGNVPHIQLLTHRLHEMSKGNPLDVMQLTQHLVEKRIIRYRSGAWILPDKIDMGNLPNDMAQALRDRLDGLSVEARFLAQSIALCPDQIYSFEECRLLMEADSTSSLLNHLNALVSAEILQFDGDHCSIRHPGWIATLIRSIDPDMKRELHLRLVKLFQLRPQTEFRVAQHLLYAGNTERGLDVLVDFSQKSMDITDQDPVAYVNLLQSLPLDWIKTFHDAIRKGKQLKRPRRDIYIMQRRVSGAAASSTDSSTAVYMKEMVEGFYRDSGLEFYYQLDPSMEPTARLERVFELTQKRYEQTDETQRLFDPITSIRFLSRTLVEVCAGLGVSHDYQLWKTLPSLQPMISLSPALEVVEMLVEGVGYRISARSERARQIYQLLLDRTAQPDRAGLDETYHRAIRQGVMRAMGMLLASMGLKESMRMAMELELDPLYEVNALQIRMLYYQWQGDTEQIESHRQSLELLRIRNNLPIMYEGANLFQEFLAYAVVDDLTGIKPIIDAIQVMANRHRAWVPTFHYAKAEQYRICGDYSNALEELEKARSLAVPGECQDWAAINSAYLKTLFLLGRYKKAVTEGHKALQAAEGRELGYVLNLLRMPLALAEAKQGNYSSSVWLSQVAIDEIEQLGTTGIHLGLVYETRARIAILMKEVEVYKKYDKLCADQYCTKGNSALTVKYEQLVMEARHFESGIIVDWDLRFDDIRRSKWPMIQLVIKTLSPYTNRNDRAFRILELLTERSNTVNGFLYFMQQEGPQLVARSNGQHPPKDLETAVRDYMSAELDNVEEATVTHLEGDFSGTHTTMWSRYSFDNYRPILLGHHSKEGYLITGLVVLVLNSDQVFKFPANLILAVSKYIADVGDATTYKVAC